MDSTDLTWMMGPVFIWSTIEPSIAVVCACMPHLAPLVQLASKSILSSHKTEERKTDLNGTPGLTPRFDGFDKMRNDDEIGLTNYVITGDRTKNTSTESVSEDLHHDHSIAVNSWIEQSSCTRPSF